MIVMTTENDYDLDTERVKFQSALGEAMVKAGAREITLLVKQQVAHTPTPWRVAFDPTVIVGERQGYECELGGMYGDDAEASANAAHIVRCVNAHQALVDALKLFVAMDKCNYELETMRRSGLFEQVDAALALAEGRESQ